MNGRAYANGATVEAAKGEKISIEIMLQNTAYSKWLCEGNVAVSLVSDVDSDATFKLDIPSPMAKRDRTSLCLAVDGNVENIMGSLIAEERGVFGDRLCLHIQRS